MFDTFQILINLITCLLFYFIIKNSQNYKFMYGKCISNEKTSIYHDEMLRGFGVLYLISIVSIFVQYTDYFKFSEIFLIFFTVILGYVDDKIDISQKNKIYFLTIIFLIFCFFDLNEFNYLKILLNYIIFIFLVLFFNQIDGIDGLSTVTFITTCLLLLFSLGYFEQFLPIILLSSIYLYFNFCTKIGIQGESGSYFFGVIIFMLFVKKSNNILNFSHLVFLGPVLFDIVITTFVRLISGKNIFKGHNNNLYQKLVSKLQSHYIVTIGYGLLQIIFSLTYIIVINSNNYLNLELFLMSYLIIFISLFMHFAIKIQKNKF